METSQQALKVLNLWRKSALPPCTFGTEGVMPGDIPGIKVLGEAEDGLTMGQLSARLGITKPSATQAVARLEQSGIAERIGDKSDRRKVYVKLTTKGQRCYREILQKITAFLDYIFRNMGEEDTAALLRLMDKYEGIVHRYINETDVSRSGEDSGEKEKTC